MYSMGNKGSKADSAEPGSGKICLSCEIYVEALCKPELWSHQQIPKRRLEDVVLESAKCPFCRLLWRATWRNAWNYQRGLIEDFLGSRGMRAVGNLDQPVKEPVKPEKWATHLWKDSGPSYECSVKAFDGLAPYLEYKISLLGSPCPSICIKLLRASRFLPLGMGRSSSLLPLTRKSARLGSSNARANMARLVQCRGVYPSRSPQNCGSSMFRKNALSLYPQKGLTSPLATSGVDGSLLTLGWRRLWTSLTTS